MALGFPFKKTPKGENEKSKVSVSLSTRLAIVFGAIAIGAGYFAYTLYAANEEAKVQINTLNGKVLEFGAKAQQTADLEQKLAGLQTDKDAIVADLAENKALLQQASDALEKCTPRTAKKGAAKSSAVPLTGN